MTVEQVIAAVALGLLGGAAQAQDSGAASAPPAASSVAPASAVGASEPSDQDGTTDAAAPSASNSRDPSAAAVAGTEGRALELGVRTGFGFAMGKAAGTGTSTIDYSMSNLTPGQIPLQLDILYRLDPRFAVGGYFSFGIVPLHKDYACGSNVDSCSGNDLRIGFQGQFHPLEGTGQVDPWVGLGIGYETLHFSASDSSGSTSLSFSGVEFANLAVGADFRLSPQFSLGPLLGLTLGEYSSASVSFGGISASEDLPDKSMHLWLNLGVRGVFSLPIH